MLRKRKNCLADTSRFKEIFVELGKKINLLLKLEDRLNVILKQDKTLLLQICINTYIP